MVKPHGQKQPEKREEFILAYISREMESIRVGGRGNEQPEQEAGDCISIYTEETEQTGRGVKL